MPGGRVAASVAYRHERPPWLPVRRCLIIRAMTTPSPTLDRLEAARRRIADRIHRTPLLSSATLSRQVGAPVYLKCENLQKTGAFKAR
ncbi:MAG: pyridoxal-phosphate dependent enzyme, partial [Longimicrobiales bacterium]|nr:pyridoxal-phosphate dependent enzyme [Longimicrobiales bacterium]